MEIEITEDTFDTNYYADLLIEASSEDDDFKFDPCVISLDGACKIEPTEDGAYFDESDLFLSEDSEKFIEEDEGEIHNEDESWYGTEGDEYYGEYETNEENEYSDEGAEDYDQYLDEEEKE